jgi:hypothetical protein
LFVDKQNLGKRTCDDTKEWDFPCKRQRIQEPSEPIIHHFYPVRQALLPYMMMDLARLVTDYLPNTRRKIEESKSQQLDTEDVTSHDLEPYLNADEIRICRTTLTETTAAFLNKLSNVPRIRFTGCKLTREFLNTWTPPDSVRFDRCEFPNDRLPNIIYGVRICELFKTNGQYHVILPQMEEIQFFASYPNYYNHLDTQQTSVLTIPVCSLPDRLITQASTLRVCWQPWFLPYDCTQVILPLLLASNMKWQRFAILYDDNFTERDVLIVLKFLQALASSKHSLQHIAIPASLFLSNTKQCLPIVETLDQQDTCTLWLYDAIRKNIDQTQSLLQQHNLQNVQTLVCNADDVM